MATNPCCCSTLQNGTRFIGIIQIISAFGAITVDVIELVRQLKSADIFPPLQISMFSLALLFGVTGLALGVFLLIAAHKRNDKHCQFWYYANLLRTIVYIGITTVSAIGGTFAYISIGLIFINIYSLWVVYAFMEEIQYRRLEDSNNSVIS